MPEDIPTVEEIHHLAWEVMETAVRVRVDQELNPQSMRGRGYVAAGLRGATEGAYSWIPQFFVSHIGPEPSRLDEPIAVMVETERLLYDHGSHIMPIENDFAALEDHLGPGMWDGTAAENFRKGFLRPIDEVTKQQSLVAFTLRHAMIANRDIHIRLRRDLRDTAQQTVTALEALEARCRSGDVTVVLSIFSALAASAAAAATLGAATPWAVAGWTFVAGASSSAAGVVGTVNEPAAAIPSRSLAAETVDGVLENMVTVVNEIQQEADRGEWEIADTLRHDLDLMTTDPTLFVTARPNELMEQADRATDESLPPEARDEARDYIFEQFEPQA